MEQESLFKKNTTCHSRMLLSGVQQVDARLKSAGMTDSFLLKLLSVLFAPLLFTIHSAPAQTPFLLDSAAAYLKILSVDIGSRPMGSPNERRAMSFAIEKFREFGLDESYLMPIERAPRRYPAGIINTNSGIAVGILKGASSRIILIGGHIDSADPEIPGANDDGSGSATVLELARVFAQQRAQGNHTASTFVFALFGGEEQGLVGSQYFVDHFDRIEDVALMLQIDMTNGSDMLTMFVDVETHSAPQWLAQAAYDEFDTLGYSGLTYPTHFFTLNSIIPGGGVGSDHQPFLERGIPAIDFTSDPNDPIHTPQDTFENFDISGLKRSGDLVYKLAKRFDTGMPEEKTGRYFLYETPLAPVFIPLWALQIFIMIAFALAVFAFITLRKRYANNFMLTESADRGITKKDFIIPGLKLFLIMLIIQTCVWLSENVVGLLKGVRFPWWSYLTGYFALGFLGGVLGIWLAFQLIPRLNMSKNPSRYFLRSLIILAAFILLLSLRSSKLAFYPASALFLLSLAILVRHSTIRILLWVASAHFMFNLIFSEGFGLIAHSFGGSPRTLVGALVLHAFYIVFFALWSFPFLLGFAAVRFDAGVDYFWLNRFRGKPGLLISGSAFAACAVVLAFQPTFSNLWKQKIDVQQTAHLDKGTVSTKITSNDYLGGTQARYTHPDGTMFDTLLTGWSSDARLHKLELDDQPWLSAQRTITHANVTDSTVRVNIELTVHTRFKPYTLTVTFSSATDKIEQPTTPLAFASTEHTVTIGWHSFPDTMLTIPISFQIPANAHVTETIEAVFLEPLIPLTITNENASVTLRSNVSLSTPLALENAQK